eukprot:751024-Hanusia_phi.AAC.1
MAYPIFSTVEKPRAQETAQMRKTNLLLLFLQAWGGAEVIGKRAVRGGQRGRMESEDAGLEKVEILRERDR